MWIEMCVKQRRFNYIMRLAGLPDGRWYRVLEIGCANGRDVVQFLNDKERYFVTGLDLKDWALKQENFCFVQGDA